MAGLVVMGTGVSPGIAIGPALVLQRRVSHVPRYDLAPAHVDKEIERLDRAVESVRTQLAEIEHRADIELGSGIAMIIDAQRLMLEDRSFVAPIRKRIRNLGQNAEWAVKAVGDDLSERFARISDPYLRERGNDLDDLATRLLRTLTGDEFRLDDLDAPVVLFAYDLSPSDTASLDRERVLAFVTDVGGRTSHTAILARSLEIPAVVGVHEAIEQVVSGQRVIIDGEDGTIVIDPDDAEVQRYDKKRSAQRRTGAALEPGECLPSVTPDGFEVRLAANIESSSESAAALRYGAAGVGLFRSEFLYLRAGSELPDEEAHYLEYSAVLQAMQGAPVTIRTLDLGGEKELPGEFATVQGDNTLLGVRAIRHSLQHVELFRVQLRALLRASVHGDLRIVFPFVSTLDELRAAKRLLAQEREELVADGHELADSVPLGVMIEVPGAAMIVDHFAAEVDFLSIGTNDLIQYLLAVDRSNDAVAQLYEPLHPAVLRLLDRVVRCAKERGVPISLCGETAADPLTAMVFLGFGIDEFSMTPNSIPVIRSLIRRMPFADAQRVLATALGLPTAREVEEHALGELIAHLPEGVPPRR